MKYIFMMLLILGCTDDGSKGKYFYYSADSGFICKNLDLQANYYATGIDCFSEKSSVTASKVYNMTNVAEIAIP